MKITGKLFKKFDTQQISDKFKKRDFVIEFADNPMYPQFISFQLTQNKTDILDNYHEGQMVEIDFNLRGREWISPAGEKKYFNTLEAWRIDQAKELVETTPAAPPVVEDTLDLEGNKDDLPF